MRWPWSRSARKPVDPHRPHPFEPTDDPGLGAMAASGAGRGRGYGSQVIATAVTDAYRRTSRCGVAGCSKERGDPIHEA